MICLPRAHFSLLPSPLTPSLPLRSAFLYFLPSPSVVFPSLLQFPDLLSSLSSRFPLWRCQWSREGLFSRGQSGLSLPPPPPPPKPLPTPPRNGITHLIALTYLHFTSDFFNYKDVVTQGKTRPNRIHMTVPTKESPGPRRPVPGLGPPDTRCPASVGPGRQRETR